MTPSRLSPAFIALMVIISGLFLLVIHPYYGAILWAIILAILFHPVYARLLKLTGRRGSLAALLGVALCVCLVVIPILVLVGLLAQEAASAYSLLTGKNLDIATQLERLRDVLPDSLVNAVNTMNLPTTSEISAKFSAAIQQLLQLMAKGFYAFGQGAIGFTVAFGVALYVLFFLFRDGKSTLGTLRRASPLDPHQTQALMHTFASVVTATVKGSMAIGLAQGTIGGVTFWLLGIPSPLLWGVVMATLSLVPAVGSGLVWAPVALYLLLSGSVGKGIILLIVGFGVISMVDNLLRPILVGKQTNLPDYLVLLSTLGGLVTFGINGFVLGPLITALFLTTWQLYSEYRGASDAAQLPPAHQHDRDG